MSLPWELVLACWPAVVACAAPPVGYLRFSLVLQAAFATWFFCAVGTGAQGAAVGVFSFVGVLWAWCGRRRERGRGRAHSPRARLVESSDGVRLTVLRSQAQGDSDEPQCAYAPMW